MSSNTLQIKDFAAKTEFNHHQINIPFVAAEDIVPIGLDIGYSSTKVYSIYGSYIFPSFPIKVSDDFTLITNPTDIKYRDENGKLWYIGDLARTEIESGRIQAQSETLFGGQRIISEEYLIMLRVGIFFGLIKKDTGNKYLLANSSNIQITTGLPDQYLERYRQDLKLRFIGHHHFEIKVGTRDWCKVSIDLSQEQVCVLSQPFGTLFSMTYNRFGELIRPDLLRKSVLFFDGGQRTVDTYHNKENSKKGKTATWEDLSMIEVIKRTIHTVSENTNGQGAFPEYSFDKLITSKEPGTVTYGRRQKYNFAKDVVDYTEEVAKEAIRQIDTLYTNLNEIDILICTGGTGKAYYNFIKQAYEGFDGLEVLIAEKTGSSISYENFTSVLANAVGFFNYTVANIKRLSKYNKDRDNKVAEAAVMTEIIAEESQSVDKK